MRFKEMTACQKNELEFEFKEKLEEASHYHALQMIDLDSIKNAKRSNDLQSLAEYQESFLANCNLENIARNRISELINLI